MFHVTTTNTEMTPVKEYVPNMFNSCFFKIILILIAYFRVSYLNLDSFKGNYFQILICNKSVAKLFPVKASFGGLTRFINLLVSFWENRGGSTAPVSDWPNFLTIFASKFVPVFI